MKIKTILILLILFACEKKEVNGKVDILLIDRAFASLSEEKDAYEAFKVNLAENALSLSHNEVPTFGRDSIISTMKGNYKLLWWPEDGNISKSGDMAYTWGPYILILLKEDSQDTLYGKYLNVWEKDIQGSWKVLIDMGNSSPKFNVDSVKSNANKK